MKICLSSKRKEELEKLHDETHDGQVRDRIKALLLASEGWTAKMIAQALRIHQATVHRHLNDFQKSDKLKPENGGSESHLLVEQTAALIKHLEELTYHHTYQIVAYVETHFGVIYSVSGMNKWLHKQGFTYKKRKGVPHKFDEQRQEDFIAYYEKLKADKADDDVILFMDAVHPTQATKVTCGWIRVGQDKVIETTGSRSRLNIIGALNLTDIANTIVTYNERVDTRSIVFFFDELRKHYPPRQKIHLILDGAGYHRTEIVKDCAYVYNIELHYLPPYSPNLNPIERLWKVMNEEARNNVYFNNKQEFTAAIKMFFCEKLPEMADKLSSRLNDNFQRLKHAS